MPKAIITGITGQDGSYLAEFLLTKGYKVYGLVRRSSHTPFERIKHILNQIEVIDADLTDQLSLDSAISQIQPDEVYNLAAQSFVPTSWKQAVLTGEVTGLGALRVLESIRRYAPKARFYQASSSEMFGKVREIPQTEMTPFYPRSPYGIAKTYAHYATINYRESYNMFAACGILFNHESPRRGLEFLSRKVTYEVAKIKKGLSNELKLGNLTAQRDWGDASEYVEMMWKMLQLDSPQDFVIAMDETHTVQEFVETAFSFAGLNWKDYVVTDPTLLRPAEVDILVGNSTKAKAFLHWQPKITFKSLIRKMVESDLLQV